MGIANVMDLLLYYKTDGPGMGYDIHAHSKTEASIRAIPLLTAVSLFS